MMSPVLEQLLETLWKDYRKRVHYAETYVQMVEARGGTVVNDHIALRTFNTQTGNQPAGIEGLSRVFTDLGYEPKGEYVFETKKLFAQHFKHKEDALAPKVFISQLEVEQLSPESQAIINNHVKNTPDLYDPQKPHAIFTRPWGIPTRGDVQSLNNESQYAAWTLLHGNSINHFTAFINEQNVDEWPDIEATVKALIDEGLPMKDEIEGEPGSKLRQSATQAVRETVPIIESDGSIGEIEWSYAYYEFAERNPITNDQGEKVLFTGFLGEQATHLFEMTKQ